MTRGNLNRGRWERNIGRILREEDGRVAGEEERENMEGKE